jgi:chromosomal replication initiation ATPase DnaA
MQDLKGLWLSVLGELEVSVTKASFKTWFKQTDILSKEDGHVVVGVPNVITKKWLEDKFHTEIKVALARADQSINTVEYKVSGLVSASNASKQSSKPIMFMVWASKPLCRPLPRPVQT